MAVAGKGDLFLIDRQSVLFHRHAVVLPEGIGQGGSDEIVVGLADDLDGLEAVRTDARRCLEDNGLGAWAASRPEGSGTHGTVFATSPSEPVTGGNEEPS